VLTRLSLLILVAALAVPAGALAQSAGDEQYTDPFGGQDQGATEQPAAPPSDTGSEPAPGGDGSAEPEPSAEAAPSAEPAQTTTSPTLPRTGAPVVLFAAAGYALLLAGVAIRRQT
jgi:hypothetical protein